MSRPRLLDLFCCAGGAGTGYFRAGFDVVGVDIAPHPRYPFPFYQADALAFLAAHGREYDAIHASPPCQKFSRVSGRSRKRMTRVYPDLIAPIRALLREIGKPYVIENVEGAPLLTPVLLCGSMFLLDVRRHRLFESNVLLFAPSCNHWSQRPRFRTLDSRRRGQMAAVIGVHGHINYAGEFPLRCAAMGIDWMTNDELSQAIPPAYTEFIGRQLLGVL